LRKGNDVKGSSSPAAGSSGGGELKIKGQAEAKRKKGKWDAEEDVSPSGFMNNKID
jgi:hypothetical protein